MQTAASIIAGWKWTTVEGYSSMAFSGIAWYNSMELVVLCFIAFKRYQGCYFWSLLVSSISVAVHILGFLLLILATRVPPYFSLTLAISGWCAMVTGQSLVLWSRLHLVHRNPKVIRALLWMIIIDAILLSVPTLVLAFGAMSPHTELFARGYNIMEQVQLVGFCVQESILSGIYIWETLKLLWLRTDGWRHKILIQLLIINAIILILDVSVVAVQYAGFYAVQVPLKAASYSVKLKLEYAILNKLIRISKPSILLPRSPPSSANHSSSTYS
ncbi:hypothetical protein V491_00002 [Pseudogymnoascus sp. VKM F-3775]|nr:hypothetical protein V491_00002 [Pseudogymnoascus sp. VKM F-3775]